MSRSSTVRVIRSTSSRVLCSTRRAADGEVVGAQADVDLGAHGRQRGAQLVGGVGDEPVLLLDAVLDAVEHRVQRGGEVGDLVAGARHDEAVLEPVEVDGRCARGHAVDRAQRAARQPPAPQRRWPAARPGPRSAAGRARGAPSGRRSPSTRRRRRPAGGRARVGRARDEPEALAAAAELDGPRQLVRRAARGRRRRASSIGARATRIAERHRHAPRRVQDLRPPGARRSARCARRRSPRARPRRGSRRRSGRRQGAGARSMASVRSERSAHDEEGARPRRRCSPSRTTYHAVMRARIPSLTDRPEARSQRRGSCG